MYRTAHFSIRLTLSAYGCASPCTVTDSALCQTPPSLSPSPGPVADADSVVPLVVPGTGSVHGTERIGRADLEAGVRGAVVRVPDQLGAGSGRDAVRAWDGATVRCAVDFQKVVRARPVVLDVERAHVKREWHSLLDDAVLEVGVLLAGAPRNGGAEVVRVHALVFDRARSGDNLEGWDRRWRGHLRDKRDWGVRCMV